MGICVTQLDAKLIERGLACTPKSVPTFTGAIVAVEKVRFFLGPVRSRTKVHISVGHATVMGEVQFFGLPDGEGSDPAAALQLAAKRIGHFKVSKV